MPLKLRHYQILTLALIVCLLILGRYTISLLRPVRVVPLPAPSSIPAPALPTPIPAPFKPSNFISPQIQILDQNQWYTNKYFTLKLKFQNQPEQTFTIHSDPYDAIFDVQIAPEEKYGCATVQTSGTIAYFIFNLLAGQPIAYGQEYSACLEWINSHQVIISEHLYNTHLFSYYIFDAGTKKRQLLGSFTSNVPSP